MGLLTSWQKSYNEKNPEIPRSGLAALRERFREARAMWDRSKKPETMDFLAVMLFDCHLVGGFEVPIEYRRKR